MARQRRTGPQSTIEVRRERVRALSSWLKAVGLHSALILDFGGDVVVALLDEVEFHVLAFFQFGQQRLVIDLLTTPCAAWVVLVLAAAFLLRSLLMSSTQRAQPHWNLDRVPIE